MASVRVKYFANHKTCGLEILNCIHEVGNRDGQRALRSRGGTHVARSLDPTPLPTSIPSRRPCERTNPVHPPFRALQRAMRPRYE